MYTHQQPSYDKEVAFAWNYMGSDREDETDVSTEPDSDTDACWKEDRSIWKGFYVLDMESPPAGERLYWTVGKGREREPTGVELLLSPTHRRQSGLRGKMLNFSSTPIPDSFVSGSLSDLLRRS
jgi:hypothetical protein